MAKNENGYPLECAMCKCLPCNSQGGSVGGVTDTSRPNEGCSGGNQNGNAGGSGAGGVRPGMNGGGCGGRGDCLDNKAVAYVYAPDQKFRLLYSAPDALAHGTLFEELYKPKGVYGNE